MKKHNKKQAAAPDVRQPRIVPSRLLTAPFWLRIILVWQLICLGLQFYPQPSTNGDNARYFILGESIASLSGYSQIHLPDNPPETQYPFVLPLFLGILRIFSDTVFIPKLAMGILAVLITLVLYRWTTGTLSGLQLPLLVVTASSAIMAQFSVILMSEIPYLLVSVAALLCYERSRRNPASRTLFWATIILTVLPVNTRSAGLAFSVAFVLYTLAGRQWRYALAHIALFALVTVVFRSLSGWGSPYLLQLLQENSYDTDRGFITLRQMFDRIGQNISLYSLKYVAFTFVPVIVRMPLAVQTTLSLTIVALVFLGWLQAWRIPRLRLTALYLFMYFGLLCLWQTQWTSERFVVPVFPLIVLLLFVGLTSLTGLFAPRGGVVQKGIVRLSGEPLPAAGMSRATVLTVWLTVAMMATANLIHLSGQGQLDKRLATDWRNYYSAADWIRLNTPAQAVVVSRKPELLYLRSHRKGVMYPCTHDIDAILAFIRENGVTHVVFDNFSWTRTSAKYLYPVITTHPDRFRVVYALANPDTYVLEYIDK